MQIMLYWPPLQSACYFCSVLALLALLNLSCVHLLSRAPGVVELEEGKKKVYSGRIELNMRIPARHVHAVQAEEVDVGSKPHPADAKGDLAFGEGGRRAEHTASMGRENRQKSRAHSEYEA